MAEADGNRTRQTEMLGLTGFEDRGAHQDPDASVIMLTPPRVPAAPALSLLFIPARATLAAGFTSGHHFARESGICATM